MQVPEGRMRVGSIPMPVLVLAPRFAFRPTAFGMAGPYSNQRAMAELVTLRGRKFRAAIVDQFIQCLGLYPIGTLVELNSGEVAVVIQQNQVRRLQPRVLILLGADKSVERYPRTIDLLMEPLTPTGDNYRIQQALPENAYGINPRDFYLA